MRTVGKYLGIVRRHAAEFRAQFDEAIREAELQDLKKEFEGIGREMRSTIEQGGAAIDEHVMTARTELDGVIGGRPHELTEAQDQPAAQPTEAPSPEHVEAGGVVTDVRSAPARRRSTPPRRRCSIT